MTTLQNTGKFRPERVNNKKFAGNQDVNPTGDSVVNRLTQVNEDIRIDNVYGFHRVTDSKERVGFLINMHATEIVESDRRLLSGVDYYFVEEDSSRFKISIPFSPYFYILCRKDTTEEVSNFLSKKYSRVLTKIETVRKEDLDLPNHLVGLKQKYLKLSFGNGFDLTKARREIMGAAKRNKEREKSHTHYTDMLAEALNTNQDGEKKQVIDHMDNILDIREYDVPHHIRASIDTKIFCGRWYSVKSRGNEMPIITKRDDIVEPLEPTVLAYDIETTKLPLKFPDAATDQIMMISYMIDGQGYLITNREIISADIKNFEFTPKPEFVGHFTIYNEINEKATIRRFFNHINDTRPHIFVTYNGDFFDWPFVEARAAVHNMDMKQCIGFSKNREGIYVSRPAMHMDCLCWVKRDSYLPVGSQGLKAVAKVKLSYDPVEVDPEDMCRLASEEPNLLASYSVSDAVATYYLYQTYIHPFIFALCTIIPMEPDEVLRKGSGTLCESLLMVEAFHANIIFPNKQEAELNKLTKDGHVLDQETYVGGHVEALESGVFRADIPCHFKIVPAAVEKLIDGLESTLRHAIEEEEKVPLHMVTNLEEVKKEITDKLVGLKNQPSKFEKPVIYHLDVGAMYPNIILTNRLQPSAMVNETDCAACDYNKPGALCQRSMKWMWRGEYFSAGLGEYQRIQQQLETEKFPSQFPGGAKRAFHELPKQDRAAYEKKRLTEFSRKVYKKAKITKMEERSQTVCQRENSFYVDTVRAFRDRRYEYKGLTKVAKQQLAVAIAKGDAGDIKSAKSRAVLYDSLQLAHKCILNSFYGYVMRKGARWHSMEMGGIVCYMGAHIIMKAREIIEQLGRPLELDTDGIWCILPSSFPDSVTVYTSHPKKSKLTISYPNAVLNFMVKDEFTNDAYHELVDAENFKYDLRSENSIFFEVDGPYLAMVLPAAKEEGKKLKKRYAVFNFDGSVAELKGFEVKRRGELELIKIFQSSVFDLFLKGNTLEECYAAVATNADYWLDILYNKGVDLSDSELFDLISENKSMSRKLEDYGAQKSTSISTAKRLAEFLGDQMVKDAGLACRYIIANKPQGAPVTERAIPLAIFQAEPAIKKHYLRKWLKDSSLQGDDIRQILDWNYYIERLGSAIQKIITIPAALQGLANPVPRVKHPDWLHKKVLEKSATYTQTKITEIFRNVPSSTISKSESNSASEICDIEDVAGKSPEIRLPKVITHKRKRDSTEEVDAIEKRSWREALGSPPPKGTTKEERNAWLEFHKKKWAYQAKQRSQPQSNKKNKTSNSRQEAGWGVVRNTTSSTLSGFLRRTQRKLFDTPWEIVQISLMNEPGMFRLWALVDQDLHQLRLVVPRIFYVNVRKPRPEPTSDQLWQRSSKILPRSRPVYNLYQYSVPEAQYQKYSQALMQDLSTPDVEGIYETQMPLEFRAILTLGCICVVNRSAVRKIPEGADTFSLDQLQFRSIATQPYLQRLDMLNQIFLYQHWSSNRQRSLWGLFLNASKRAHIFILDSVSSDQMPNLKTLYTAERDKVISKSGEEKVKMLPDTVHFVIRVERNLQQVSRLIQAALKVYKNEGHGAAMIVLQTATDVNTLTTEMPMLNEFPLISTHVQDIENLYSTIEWQKIGAKMMIGHYLKSYQIIELMREQCRYFHMPIGNVPADTTVFGTDLFYARHLQKQNFVLWCSPTEKPDFGGNEHDDNRLLTDFEESSSSAANHAGTYSSVCVELNIDNLAVNTLLQYHRIHDVDGVNSFVAYHNVQQTSVQDMAKGEATAIVSSCDETASCNAAFRILKSMINTWLLDVSIYKNVFADYQIIHFYRWLRSPNALLYDPALRRTLYTYMKKLFIQLVAEFKTLGAVIVFANFNKIILCTKKRTVADAIGYTEFVVQTIRNKELFHSIDMTFEQCWEYLIWLDLHNYGGVRGKIQKSPEELEHEPTEETDEDSMPEIVMNWNLMECLAVEGVCQASFSVIIAGYISAVYQFMCNHDVANSTFKPQRRNSTFSDTLSTQLGLGSLENTAEFAKKLISGEMSQKLFQTVQKIHNKIPEKTLTVQENPNLDLDGQETKKINPALELIKSVCKVLSLDKEIESEVQDLQVNSLRLIQVGCFGDNVEWKDPCLSLILPEVICKACNHTRDIDLCKDTYCCLVNDRHAWKCPICDTHYENAEIEYALIHILNRKSMGYILQDLQCCKCGEIKRENISDRCSCLGDFKTLISKDQIATFAKICKAVARKSKMALLAETVNNTQLCINAS